ncbi:MAG: hypothetical protein J7K53_08945 [Bacteroidales bacterium]|nr:hypothetical protein [Bacteroidales bacterium]
MDIKRIELLLQKFYSGVSAIEEEKELKDFFTTNDVPRHLWAEQEMFTYYHVGGKGEIGDKELENKIIKTIKGAEQEEAKRFTNRRKILYMVSSAAAVVALLTVAYFAFIFDTAMQDTYDNPEIAYVQTKETLLFVSAKLNKGTKDLYVIGKLDEATKPLSNISKIEYSTKSIYTISLFGTGMKNLNNLSRIINPIEKNN